MSSVATADNEPPAFLGQDLPPLEECKSDLRQAVKDGSLPEAEDCLRKLSAVSSQTRQDLKCLDDEGLTVLHQAVFVAQGLALLKLLVRYGGDIGVRDEEGCTLLHTASMVSNRPVAGWLINEGANLAALDHEGHLPLDRCEDPILQDMIFQAMARAGLVGLAMPSQSQLTWMDISDRAGDSDYGTSSSVGSLSEDEDRLSLHSTQSFSSADECGVVDRQSPMPGSVSADSPTGDPTTRSVIPVCAQLVRVKEVEHSQVLVGSNVQHVQWECVSKIRKAVSVTYRSEQELRRAQLVFIGEATSRNIAAGNDVSGDGRHPVATVCRSTGSESDKCSVGQVNLFEGEAGSVCQLPDRRPATSSILLDRPIQEEEASCDPILSHALEPDQEEVLNELALAFAEASLDDGEDIGNYLESCGSSSDETIRAAESDAESIATELSSSCGDLHQIVTSSLDSVAVSHSLDGPGAGEDMAAEMPASFACSQFVEDSWRSRRQLLATVDSLSLVHPARCSGSCTSSSLREEQPSISSKDTKRDDTLNEGLVKDDVTCQASCQTVAQASADMVGETSRRMTAPRDIRLSAAATYHEPQASPSRPTKYLGSSERRARRPMLTSDDYTPKGKGLSRRYTVSEVDMGWVAPRRQVKSNTPAKPAKPLKSLLRRSSVSELESQPESRGDVPKIRRKKSVSFPAEVLLSGSIHDGDIDEVKTLISGSIAVDALLDNGLTPLHLAVLERQREIVKLLLASGASVVQRDSDGWTALHAAATEGTVPVTHLLLENGADPWVKTSKEKKTAYELASNDNVRLVLSKAMGEAYRSINLMAASAVDESDISEDEDEEIDDDSVIEDSDDDRDREDVRIRDSDVEDNNSESADEDEDSDDEQAEPGCETTRGGSHAAADDTIFSTPVTEKPETDQRSPSLTLAEAIQRKDSDILDRIEDADMEDLDDPVGASGDTLLHIAARAGDISVLEKLLDCGLQSSAVNSANETPFDVAATQDARDALHRAMTRPVRPLYNTAI